MDLCIASTRRREGWKIMKNLRTNRREGTNYRLDQKVNGCYKNLFTEDRLHFWIAAEERNGEMGIREEFIGITEGDVREAVLQTKNGKIHGPDGVQIEILKNSPWKTPWYTYSFNSKRGNDYQHTGVCHISVTCIKKPQKNCANYKRISVNKKLSRTCDKIIK